MAYDIYFDKVLLPVAPSKIKTKINNKNKTVELINEGEVNVLKAPGLTKIQFDIVLPNVKYPFAKYPDGFKKAIYYLDMLEKYKKEMKPFQFIISRTLQNGEVPFYTNMKMSLEDYSVEDNVNEGFDIKVSVNLTQYKAYGTKTVDISEYVTKTESSTSDEGKRTAGDGAATTGTAYTIASGDTLWNIAKKKLGNGTKWTAIYDANKSTIESAAKSRGRSSSSNGHWIYPGTVITIP